MPSPLPNFPPRQEGESDFHWRNRRSIALTGESLYERRQRQGLARGLSGRAAAGHTAVGGRTEYDIRRERTIERYGLTPTQLRYLKLDTELQAAGYTPESTGLSQTNLRRVWPRLKWINVNTSPAGQISPDVILEATEMERDGFLPRHFAVDHINSRYNAMYEFKVQHSNQLGNFLWFSEKEEYEGLTANWWYYH